MDGTTRESRRPAHDDARGDARSDGHRCACRHSVRRSDHTTSEGLPRLVSRQNGKFPAAQICVTISLDMIFPDFPFSRRPERMFDMEIHARTNEPGEARGPIPSPIICNGKTGKREKARRSLGGAFPAAGSRNGKAGNDRRDRAAAGDRKVDGDVALPSALRRLRGARFRVLPTQSMRTIGEIVPNILELVTGCGPQDWYDRGTPRIKGATK